MAENTRNTYNLPYQIILDTTPYVFPKDKKFFQIVQKTRTKSEKQALSKSCNTNNTMLNNNYRDISWTSI